MERTASPGEPAVERLDHAAIGNGRVLALVHPTSAIDWLCLPRFDSPSVFARLLDRDRGGTFRILGAGGPVKGTLRYLINTNVTRIIAREGEHAWEVIDFAPRIPTGLTVHSPLTVIRLVRPLAGQPRLRIEFDPRPDYARTPPGLRESGEGVELTAAPPLHLVSNLPSAFILDGQEFSLTEPLFFAFSAEPREPPLTIEGARHALEATVAGWRQWARTCALPTFRPELVLRSALCLKLHASEDTGAVIAAATTSVPEAMGTERTWDYRYCWLRDAAFVVEALRRLGHLVEGERFIHFLRDVAEAGPLQPVYGIGGERELTETFLPHLAGFRGNGHVRVGNAAWQQQQHDLMGEMILCIDSLVRDCRLTSERPTEYWPLVQRLVADAIAAADQPDTGLWEFRTLMRPYTFSRAMCWVALARGGRFARALGNMEPVEEWERRAAHLRDLILAEGFSATRGCFTQALGGEHADASNLLLPSIGLVRAHDPRFLATLDRYEEVLVDRGLMLRYRHDDDFGETTSAFILCSFWWTIALAQAGRVRQAIEVFERLASHANPVGLFSEDIDPATGDLLGNFPQAYTHVGLIQAATTIGSILEAEGGHLLAWN
jgi:GH15 family glucan-1,4-alpha-glucosidase